MVATNHYDLDIDTTLGGNNASNYIIPSQKAIKSYVDNNSGSTVDQVFDSTSANAQSGIAIEGELSTNYQPTLVSGTNIKTINNNSILGSGNIDTPYRNIGEIVTSALPLIDAGLHLLDGSLISGGGMYEDFVTYIAGLYGDGTNVPSYFTTEANWQSTYATYGECGKFVYTPASGDDPATVRLPKVTGILEGTTTLSELGNIIAAGLPSITHSHTGTLNTTGAHTHTRGTMNITGSLNNTATDEIFYKSPATGTGAITPSNATSSHRGTNSNSGTTTRGFSFDASKSWTGSTSSNGDHTHTLTLNNNSSVNSIYGNASTVQPQVIKCFVYIVVATSTKTDVEVDIDQIATDVNTISTDLNNTKVSKAGDTMTGDLVIQKGGNPALHISNLDITKGTVPSVNKYSEILFNDSSDDSTYANTRMGLVGLNTRTDGSVRMNFTAYKNEAGSTTSANFHVDVAADGTASCTFPNTTCVDGQWIDKYVSIADGTSLNGSTELTYTLTNVPNDGYKYEVLLSGRCITGSTSGNSCQLAVRSDFITWHYISLCYAQTRTSYSSIARGNTILPLTSSRKIYVYRNSNYNGTFLLELIGYRRIGTNS